MKSAPPLHITATVLYQLISDPKFFSEVPVFYFMKKTAQEAVTRVRAAATGAGDPGCTGCGDLSVALVQVFGLFVGQIRNLLSDGDIGRQMLDPLRDYVQARTQTSPACLIIKYKEPSGQIVTLQV